jgi:hypothetical protein
MEHTGASQQGKTTGAQRFNILHGLGDVKGDYSVAALRSLIPTLGGSSVGLGRRLRGRQKDEAQAAGGDRAGKLRSSQGAPGGTKFSA